MGEATEAGGLGRPAKMNAGSDRVDRAKSGTIDAGELGAARGAMGVPGDAGHVRAAIRRYGGGARANLGRAEFARLTRELAELRKAHVALLESSAHVPRGTPKMRASKLGVFS